MELIIIGTLAYALIKICGYSAYAKYLNYIFSANHNIWKIGAIRALIGVVIGGLHNAFSLYVLDVYVGRLSIRGEDTLLFFGLFVLLRVFEWWLIIHLYYNGKSATKLQLIKGIVPGIIWSFILDIPVIFGLLTVVSSIC